MYYLFINISHITLQLKKYLLLKFLLLQAFQGFQEGLEESALVLLQTFLGFAAVLGCAGFGLVLVRPSAQCLVSKQYLCQTAMLGIGNFIIPLDGNCYNIYN